MEMRKISHRAPIYLNGTGTGSDGTEFLHERSMWLMAPEIPLIMVNGPH